MKILLKILFYPFCSQMSRLVERFLKFIILLYTTFVNKYESLFRTDKIVWIRICRRSRALLSGLCVSIVSFTFDWNSFHCFRGDRGLTFCPKLKFFRENRWLTPIGKSRTKLLLNSYYQKIVQIIFMIIFAPKRTQVT